MVPPTKTSVFLCCVVALKSLPALSFNALIIPILRILCAISYHCLIVSIPDLCPFSYSYPSGDFFIIFGGSFDHNRYTVRWGLILNQTKPLTLNFVDLEFLEAVDMGDISYKTCECI